MDFKKTLHNPAQIPALEVMVERVVRFEELDPMGIVWHGRYASWLEDGRETLGRRYGVAYVDFYEHGCMAPIKRLVIDYLHPLRHDTVYLVYTSLLWTESARMDFSYVITDREGTVHTRASSTQLFTDVNGVLLLDHPSFYRAFLDRWRRGEFGA